MGKKFKSREELIEKLWHNLHLVQAKLKISQADLVGIGRQTVISIENGKSKMRWDTFLAMILVISQYDDSFELLQLWELSMDKIVEYLQGEILFRKDCDSIMSEKIWTDSENDEKEADFRGTVPLPIGLKGSKCPKRGSCNLKGAIISKTAYEQDSNILCLDCGYWRD